MPLDPSRLDADTPPDGDFASYVERLTRQPDAARQPASAASAATRGTHQAPGAARVSPRRAGGAAAPARAARPSFWQRVWNALQQASAASQHRK